MYNMMQDHSELEQKLESIDFYSRLADKDGMLRDFMSRLDQREEHSKPRERRRVMRPAAIAAMIVILTLITGFTVFADGIEGLLKQLFFTGGVANKVEQLELSEGYPDDADSKVIITGAVVPEEYEGKAMVFGQKTKFESLDEAIESIRFTPLEPKGLDNWELVSVKAFSNGKDINPYSVEMIYENLDTKAPSSGSLHATASDGQSIRSEDIAREASIYVYQHYVGENAALRIDTTKDIQIISLNGIEAVLKGPLPYERGNAYSLTWTQGDIAIDLCPSSCTYDELISFAEALIAPAGDE